MPGTALLTHRTVRRGLLRRVLLYILISQLLLVFMALVVYLGRHAGT
ncbi:hypothetical protein [Streptomyces piniterrae]|nr:hypothetical protein [Streptomyces piniterrae]